MRKSEYEITDRVEMDAILSRAPVCRLGLSVGDRPYVVPLAFGYEGGSLYFHSSPKGKKMEMLRGNPRVCFEVDTDIEVVASGDPCRWHIRYNSVIGFGTVSIVEDAEEKTRALEAIKDHYSAEPVDYGAIPLEAVAVIRLDIESMTGRTR
ncbi:MAG: pyridoxamine 5'-phosphate oxidase family protein [Planctomycetota bacterium]|jgi:nitroimidazol reductase NimA-like FMN-containing flavoprotein (pyridoxamine 5'-phosphate oxidase superfamily)